MVWDPGPERDRPDPLPAGPPPPPPPTPPVAPLEPPPRLDSIADSIWICDPSISRSLSSFRALYNKKKKKNNNNTSVRSSSSSKIARDRVSGPPAGLVRDSCYGQMTPYFPQYLSFFFILQNNFFCFSVLSESWRHVQIGLIDEMFWIDAISVQLFWRPKRKINRILWSSNELKCNEKNLLDWIGISNASQPSV